MDHHLAGIHSAHADSSHQVSASQRSQLVAWAWGLKFEILAYGLGLGGDHDLSLDFAIFSYALSS